MAWVYADRVLDTSVTTGTGAMVVSGTSPLGWRTFSTACAVADTFYYTIVDPITGAWETGDGTYSALNTVARTQVRQSSNANALVNFAANTKQVFLDVIGQWFGTALGNYLPIVGGTLTGDLFVGDAWATGGVQVYHQGWISITASTDGDWGGFDFWQAHMPVDQRSWTFQPKTGNFVIGAMSDGFVPQKQWFFNRDGRTTLPGALYATDTTIPAIADSNRGFATAYYDDAGPHWYAQLINYGGGYGEAIYLAYAGGSPSAPTAVLSGDWITGIIAQGYNGSVFRAAATIDFYSDGAVGTVVPGRIELTTKTAASASNVWSFKSDGSTTLPGALTGTSATFSGDITSALAVTATNLHATNYLYRTGADSSTAALISGVTRGIRFGNSATGSSIEGVDNTGVTTYQPLTIGGSAVNITAPLTGTTATFSGTVLAPGAQIQLASVVWSPVATGTALIPADDTIPQIGEGTEFMTLAITPKSATSQLVVEVTFVGTSSVINNLIVALFRDSGANALAATITGIGTAGLIANTRFGYVAASGSTSATTFRVRAGCNAAGTTTMNGSAGTRYLGGVMASSIVIREIAT